jgi:hypothetical protein
MENSVEYEDLVKAAAGNVYNAGADTTVSALGTFALAMMANPEAQRRAQQEIDTVVGHNRLPNFDDEDSLPYVSALVKEVLRWKNVLPVGSSSHSPRRSMFLIHPVAKVSPISFPSRMYIADTGFRRAQSSWPMHGKSVCVLNSDGSKNLCVDFQGHVAR